MSVVRMALGRGAQLADEHGLTEVHFHIPSGFKGKGDDILGLKRKVLVNSLVKIRGLSHAPVKIPFEACLDYFFRDIVPMGGRKILPLLSQNSMALQIAIQSEIPDDIKGVVNILCCAPWLVPSM